MSEFPPIMDEHQVGDLIVVLERIAKGLEQLAACTRVNYKGERRLDLETVNITGGVYTADG